MGSLSLVTTIVDRKIINRYMEVYQDNVLRVAFLALGYGTASNEILDYLGLESNQKAVTFSVMEEASWLKVKKQMERKLKIDAPGGGISFAVPLSSIGGMKALQFLLETQEYQKEEESTMKKFTKILALVLALTLTLCAFVACKDNGDNGDSKGTIAVIAKGETHAFWQAVKAGAMAAGEKYGYNVTFRGPTAESEEYVNAQREMVQAALNTKDIKAIVLATIGLGFGDELTSAYDKGLPVVEFDSGLYSGGADITEGKDPTIGGVATDNFAAAGVAAAASLVLLIPPVLFFVITQSNVLETMAHSGMKD